MLDLNSGLISIVVYLYKTKIICNLYHWEELLSIENYVYLFIGN